MGERRGRATWEGGWERRRGRATWEGGRRVISGEVRKEIRVGQSSEPEIPRDRVTELRGMPKPGTTTALYSTVGQR